jgi:hypothetical protein
VTEQIEVESQCPILDETGRPANFGWARRPLYVFEKGKLRVPHRYVTESDRYCFFSQTHLFLFEIEDAGFLGSIRITCISLRDRKTVKTVYTSSFTLGSFNMPSGSESGSIQLYQKRASIEFWTRQSDIRIIKIDIPLLSHGVSLRGEIVLIGPESAQSLFTHSGWHREKTAFRYSRTSPWYFVEGVMQLGRQDVILTRGNAFGVFDWDRGCRSKTDIQYRARGCGIVETKQIGFSLGYSTADTDAATENAFFIDGKLHKLNQVTFQISPKDWLLPWQFTSADGKVEMTFRPVLVETTRNRIFHHSIGLSQFFGYFSGKVLQDDGQFFAFRNITGFAERRKTRF